MEERAVLFASRRTPKVICGWRFNFAGDTTSPRGCHGLAPQEPPTQPLGPFQALGSGIAPRRSPPIITPFCTGADRGLGREGEGAQSQRR